MGTDLTCMPMADGRLYQLCTTCKLISLDQEFLPSAEKERSRYEQHHNSPQDQGYVRFLQKAVEPALAYLQPGMQGLDYGCGPVPVLTQLLEKTHLLSCEYYDPFFFPKELSNTYDYIFSTETFEHFFQPGQEIKKLHSLLADGGILVVMTEFWTSVEAFESWWYRRDYTHICFFHALTFEYIARQFGFRLLHADARRVAILQKTELE